MTLTIALSTLITAWAFRHEKLTVILPYVMVCLTLTSEADWAMVSMLLVVFSLVERISKAVKDG